LINIPGVGEATMKKLLLNLKSVKNIKEADINTLNLIVGNSKAPIIKKYFDGLMN
jgi:excinuclease ABC subunit C